MIDFVGKRINGNSDTLDKKITQLQLPTFSNVPRGKTKGKGNDKTRSLQTDRALFGRLIVISQQSLTGLQVYLLYTMALTNSNGSLSKANKAQAMHVLEEHESPLEDPELFDQAYYVNDKENTGVFIDHMAVVHKCSLRSGINIFDDLLTCISFLFSAFREGSRVALISDRYDSKLFIKAGARKRCRCLSISQEVIVNSKSKTFLS